MLHHIAYVSRARTNLGSGLLSDILGVSEINNTRDGITGILMYHDLMFFQILEGQQENVIRCSARILDDERHTSVFTMLDHTVESRVFSKWAMAYCGPDRISEHTNNEIRVLADLQSDRLAAETWALKLATLVFQDRTVGQSGWRV